jgi:hypothetical protein
MALQPCSPREMTFDRQLQLPCGGDYAEIFEWLNCMVIAALHLKAQPTNHHKKPSSKRLSVTNISETVKPPLENPRYAKIRFFSY